MKEIARACPLVDDVELSSTVRINKSVTIRDDGTPRSFLIGDAAARGLEFHGDSGIEESAYPTVTLQGTAAGGLTIRAKNPETVFDYVALYVIRAKLVTSGSVTVTSGKRFHAASPERSSAVEPTRTFSPSFAAAASILTVSACPAGA